MIDINLNKKFMDSRFDNHGGFGCSRKLIFGKSNNNIQQLNVTFENTPKTMKSHKMKNSYFRMYKIKIKFIN